MLLKIKHLLYVLSEETAWDNMVENDLKLSCNVQMWATNDIYDALSTQTATCPKNHRHNNNPQRFTE